MSDPLGYGRDLLRRLDRDWLRLPALALIRDVALDWLINPPPIDLAYPIPLPPSDAELAARAEAAGESPQTADEAADNKLLPVPVANPTEKQKMRLDEKWIQHCWHWRSGGSGTGQDNFQLFLLTGRAGYEMFQTQSPQLRPQGFNPSRALPFPGDRR
jgi:hypothetical protein